MSGLQWTEAVAGRLAEALAAANGRRTTRLLSAEQVQRCAEAALEAEFGFAWVHGGEPADARQFTSLALAVVRGEQVTVGVAPARGPQVTPERAWPELGPWDRSGDAANVPRCQAWAGRGRAGRFQVARAPPPARGVDRESFLEAVLAAPEDDAPRLVFADWLMEQGDPRGEFIAVQCRIARGDRSEGLVARERELLRLHGRAWGCPLPQFVVLRWERGFVRTVRFDDASVFPEVEPFLRQQPVRSLLIGGTRALDAARLAAAPWLARVQALDVRSDPRGPGGPLSTQRLAALLESRHLRELRRLALVGQHLGVGGARLLAERGPQVLPALRELDLSMDVLGDPGAIALAESPVLAGLEVLTLADDEVRVAGAEALAFTRSPGKLRSLSLAGNQIGDEGALALARAPRLASLRSLNLERNHLGPEAVKALLDSPHLASVSFLQVAGNPISQELLRHVSYRTRNRRPRK